MFTLLSVACAERITATSSSKGVGKSSSLRGSGLAARSARYSAAMRSGFKASGDLHARLHTGVRRQQEHALAAVLRAAGAQHDALGNADAHLARREVGDHHHEAADEILGPVAGAEI